MKKIILLSIFILQSSSLSAALPELCKNNDFSKVNLVYKESYYRPQDFEVVLPPQDFIASLKVTASLFRKNNITLIALILPPKGITGNVPDSLYTNKSLSKASITRDYNSLVKIFSESGIITPNLLDFSNSKPRDSFYLPTDHHWNNTILDDLSKYALGMIPKGVVISKLTVKTTQKQIFYRGSLKSIVDSLCGNSTAKDERIQSYKSIYPNQGLLDEGSSEVSLIGTSNSRRPLTDGSIEESFASLLAKNGRFAIYNGAIDGGGPYSSLENYLMENYQENKPKVIFWEFYAYEPPISSDFLERIQPLINKEAIKIITWKDMILTSKGSSASFDLNDNINYLKLNLQDKSLVDFDLTVTFADNKISKLISRLPRVDNNGEFYIYLGNISAKKLVISSNQMLKGTISLVKF